MQVGKILSLIENLAPADFILTQSNLEQLAHRYRINKNPLVVAQVLHALPKNIYLLIEMIRMNEIETLKRIKRNFTSGKKNCVDIGKDDVLSELCCSIPDEITLVNSEICIKARILHEIIQAIFGYDNDVIQKIIEPIRNIEESMLAKRMMLIGIIQKQQQIDDEMNSLIQQKRSELGFNKLEEEKKEINKKIKAILQEIEKTSVSSEERIALEKTKENLMQEKNRILLFYSEIDNKIDLKNFYKTAKKQKEELSKKELDEQINKKKQLEEEIRRIKMFQEEKQISTLHLACDTYQAHLFRVVVNELENVDPAFATNVMVTHVITATSNDGLICRTGIDLAAEQAILAFHQKKQSCDLVFRNQHQSINNSCILALVKYNAIVQMKNTLEDQRCTTTEKLDRFKKIFFQNEPIIKKNRDSATILFFKVVATIFSLGIGAPFFWFWHKSQGEQLADSVREELIKYRAGRKFN